MITAKALVFLLGMSPTQDNIKSFKLEWEQMNNDEKKAIVEYLETEYDMKLKIDSDKVFSFDEENRDVQIRAWDLF